MGEMGLVVIFAIVSILAVFALLREGKRKNVLGVIFSVLTVGVFGWFTVMTTISLLSA